MTDEQIREVKEIAYANHTIALLLIFCACPSVLIFLMELMGTGLADASVLTAVVFASMLFAVASFGMSVFLRVFINAERMRSRLYGAGRNAAALKKRPQIPLKRMGKGVKITFGIIYAFCLVFTPVYDIDQGLDPDTGIGAFIPQIISLIGLIVSLIVLAYGDYLLSKHAAKKARQTADEPEDPAVKRGERRYKRRMAGAAVLYICCIVLAAVSVAAKLSFAVLLLPAVLIGAVFFMSIILAMLLS